MERGLHDQCAGVILRNLLTETSEEEWDTIMNGNLRSAWQCAKVAAEHMRENGGGAIVNTASFASRAPGVGSGAYAVAKCGVSSLTRVLFHIQRYL